MPDGNECGLGIHIPVNGHGFALHGIFRAQESRRNLRCFCLVRFLSMEFRKSRSLHGEIHPNGVNGGNGGQRRGAEGVSRLPMEGVARPARPEMGAVMVVNLRLIFASSTWAFAVAMAASVSWTCCRASSSCLRLTEPVFTSGV